MKLTKKAAGAATYTGDGSTRCVLWDDDLKGFGLRVYPSGSKSFVLSYRVGGRKRMAVIGKFPELTVGEARKLARRHLGEAQTEHADLVAQRRSRERTTTVEELCARYLELHASQKKTGREDERKIRKHILPAWRKWRTVDVRRLDVEIMHKKIGKKAPYEANRVLTMIAVMFRKAKEWELFPEDMKNPAAGVKPFKEHQRERYVTPEELPRLAEAIDAEPNEYVRAALWLYLLTGLRKGELLAARWADVDFARAELAIPETKSGRRHVVPLSKPALDILRELPRSEFTPYVFPGNEPGGHLKSFYRPWYRIRAAAGVDDVRLHDLRRTVGSWLAGSGESLHLIAKVLNHQKTETTAIYARLAEEHARAALERHAAKLMGVAGKGPSADVVNLEDEKLKKAGGDKP